MTYGIIYKLTFINGKSYIGQTTQNYKQYISNYYSIARTKSSKSERSIIKALKKYGPEGFTDEIMFEFENKSELSKKENQVQLDLLEDVLCKFYNTYERQYGYNIKEAGSNGKMSNVTKEKLRNRIRTNETKNKMSISAKIRINQYGIPFKGRSHSEESRKKISMALMGKPSKNKGKKMSEEFCNIMRKSMESKRDKTVYFFKNIKTGELINGLKSDIRKKYNMDKAALTRVIQGKNLSHKDWMLFN